MVDDDQNQPSSHHNSSHNLPSSSSHQSWDFKSEGKRGGMMIKNMVRDEMRW